MNKLTYKESNGPEEGLIDIVNPLFHKFWSAY
jgi:hypothetical protein